MTAFMRGHKAAGALIRSTILAALAGDPKRVWTAPELHQRVIRLTTLTQVRRLLSKLHRTHLVELVRFGGKAGDESTFRAMPDISQESETE